MSPVSTFFNSVIGYTLVLQSGDTRKASRQQELGLLGGVVGVDKQEGEVRNVNVLQSSQVYASKSRSYKVNSMKR